MRSEPVGPSICPKFSDKATPLEIPRCGLEGCRFDIGQSHEKVLPCIVV
jgi:hypothetical protein